MSPGNLIRRCRVDLSRWSRAGRDSARYSLYLAKSPELGSASASYSRTTPTSLPPPRGSTIAPTATSSAATSASTAAKSP
jgi:hypothetical protein